MRLVHVLLHFGAAVALRVTVPQMAHTPASSSDVSSICGVTLEKDDVREFWEEAAPSRLPRRHLARLCALSNDRAAFRDTDALAKRIDEAYPERRSTRRV